MGTGAPNAEPEPELEPDPDSNPGVDDDLVALEQAERELADLEAELDTVDEPPERSPEG